MIYLAIDFGTKRVGIAWATTWLAEPLTVVQNTDQLFPDLLKLIKKYAPDIIVIGRSEKKMAALSELFSAELEQYLTGKLDTVPQFAFADETLSSVEAVEKLHQAGKRDVRLHGPIDHYAAAQVLQEYLDLHHLDESR